MARILFVDDDAITLQILSKAAELLGHQAILSGSGEQAIELASTLQPDLIMLDMMMPDMDGLDVLSRLREKPHTAGIPVIILSAGVNLDDAVRVRAAGAQGYLMKPISLKKLLDTITRFAPGEKPAPADSSVEPL